MSLTFEDLLQQAYCPAMIRQRAFGEFLNGRDWNLDLKTGIVKFGDDLTFPIQLLGSYSEISGTWLWSWDNPGLLSWPSKILEFVNKLRDRGGIFSIPSFPLENISGHEISMVCSHLLGGIPYYRGPYPNGAVFFLVLDIPEDMNRKMSPVGCIEAMLDALNSQYIYSHREMCLGCLKSQHFDVDETNEHVLIGKRGQEEIRIELNEAGLLCNAEAKI